MTGALHRVRVVVTRPRRRHDSLVVALRDRGAIPVSCPTIAVNAAKPEWIAQHAIEPLVSADRPTVVFTSGFGATVVGNAAARAGATLGALLRRHDVIAVGPATAAVLGRYGVDWVRFPSTHSADALVELLLPVASRIVLLRSTLGRTALPSLLRQAGKDILDVPVYRTLLVDPPDSAVKEIRRGVDVVAFTSPSTVRGFVRSLKHPRKLWHGARIACIGPVTADAARQHGFTVHVEASEHTGHGLVQALERSYRYWAGAGCLITTRHP